MQCMSCKEEMGVGGKIFHSLLICPGCNELALKAEVEIKREIERAKGHAMNWLTDHIMRGGLLLGGSGENVQDAAADAARRIHEGARQVHEVRGQEAVPGGGSGTPSEGDDPQR